MEQGNWTSVLVPKTPVPVLDGTREVAELHSVIRIVASSMRLQVRGDVAEAWKQLAVAAGRLAPMMVNREAGEVRVLVTPSPKANVGILQWTWRVSLVIWREQQELLRLRSFFGASGRTRQEQLVAACIEHWRWIEDDPWVLKRATFKADGIRVEATRANICARANRLVRLVDPTARDLNDIAGWKAAGKFPGLCAMAFETVAEGPAEPWTSENSATAHVPVREGRRRFWERATR